MAGLLRARHTTDNRWDPDDVPWLVVGLLCIGSLLFGFAYLLDYSALDVWTGIIVLLVALSVSVPMFQWVARKEGDPWLFRVLFVALLVKFVASMARYFMVEVMYGGNSDASRYHGAGVMFANRLRDGAPIHPIESMQGFPIETQRMGDLVGVFYTVTGPSQYAGFFMFALLCFWGQVLMLRAFKVAVPEGDYRRYALLVLFLPSLLFWPSSIGKEAAIVFCLGLTAYGCGLLLAPRPQLKGAIYFAAGTMLVTLVRPHVALMSIAGLVLAMVVGLLGRSPSAKDASGAQGGVSSKGRMVRLGALVLLLVLAAGTSARLGDVMGEDGELSSQSALEGAMSQTATGGSEFQPVAVNGPSQVPAGVVSVFFRPFPWEARSLSSLLAAGESLLLVALFAANWRRVASLPKYAVKRPFVTFCCVYALLFAIGFSYIANFGILARQRVQALPVLLVLLALPPVGKFAWTSRRTTPDGGEETERLGDSVTTTVATLQEQNVR